MSSLVQRFERNNHGRDLIVGDIHGQFTLLQRALDAIEFDPVVDRLFSVGDLVDRGPESEDALEWLAKPWFHAVLGNHEDMAFGWASGLHDREGYVANGGAWFIAQPPEHQREFAEHFKALPILIEIETEHGLVGIVHGECPVHDWDELKRRLLAEAASVRLLESAVTQTNCIWGRCRLEGMLDGEVKGVSFVVSGHTGVDAPVKDGNSIFIDTLGWLPRAPTSSWTFVDARTGDATSVDIRESETA